MVGYMIASPIFAHVVRSANPMKVIALGLFIWALANLATGTDHTISFMPSLFLLVIDRLFVDH
jgi:sugar phosphate permease